MKLRADTLILKTQLLVTAGIVVAQALGRDLIASLLFTLTFVLTVCLWLTVAERRIGRINILAIMIVIVSCISVAVNALVTNTIVSFSYIKKLIMFWSTVLFFATMSEYRPERSVVHFAFRLNTFLTIFLIVIYFVQNSQMHLWNNRVTIYLTFRFTNPNLTAVFLSAICMIEMICAAVSRKRLSKTMHAGLAVFMVLFVFETRARNAQLLLVFFIAVYMVMVLFPRVKLRMTRGMAALIATFPLLFAIGYMLLIYTPVVQKLFEFLAGAGKDLDSRVGIWTIAFEAFASSPLFGAYSQIVNSTTHSQLHNTHMDVMASYGVIVLIILCFFLYCILRQVNMKNHGRMNMICLVGFSALLLTGIGEAMIFSGGLGVYILVGILLMLVNFDFAEEGKLIK